MASRMPFSIHEYLRQARHRHDDPLFPTYGNAKKYERMPQIVLDEPTALDISLADAMHERRSFHSDGGLRLNDLAVTDLSNLFGLALRANDKGKRPYPSGGGLYPVETYFVGTLDGTPSTHVYHYDPTAHALADLWPMPGSVEIEDIYSPMPEYIAPACIILTGMWGRNGVKYGDFGYYLGMLETGHIAQNILLAAAALDIGAKPVGGFDDAIVTELLDIDENLEQVVYTITVGQSM
jgi:SagB-type dehydrogenase family enzyme